MIFQIHEFNFHPLSLPRLKDTSFNPTDAFQSYQWGQGAARDFLQK